MSLAVAIDLSHKAYCSQSCQVVSRSHSLYLHTQLYLLHAYAHAHTPKGPLPRTVVVLNLKPHTSANSYLFWRDASLAIRRLAVSL
ncbi:hypothetical protein GGI35DRAFT_410350 [Trichoderma velutinum]